MRIFKAKSLAALPALALLVLGAAGAAAQSIPLAAHRAFYELVLDPSKPGMKVDGARGRIVYEVTGSACTGWAITLRQVTELNSGEGKRTVSDLRSTTWEDGDAKSYRFKTQNFLDQEIREEVDGTLDRAKDSIAVRLTKPKSERLTLKGNILLPTEHIRKLLVAAAAGERTLEAKVFDGSPDGKRIYDTLSVLGTVVAGDKDLEEASRRPELGSLKRYPVTISYFEPGTGERTPTYVLGFELYENGVSRALRLDYGSFAMRGELKTIEFLKPTPCKR
ncbi:MAG TPA: cell envelope integrity EipB family protein [Xanthobacteraceae bacterium]|jgi:hypothetical protein